MSNPIPSGMNGLIPHIVCSPCVEAIAFYKKAFGAEEVMSMPSPDGRIMHAQLSIDGNPLFLVDDFPEYCGGKSETATALGGSPVTIHRFVKDCDASIQKAVDAGCTVAMPAADMFWGDRYGMVVDPYGHKWSIATHQRELTRDQIAEAMKEAFAQMPQ